VQCRGTAIKEAVQQAMRLPLSHFQQIPDETTLRRPAATSARTSARRSSRFLTQPMFSLPTATDSRKA
jgi:hypothetical protein